MQAKKTIKTESTLNFDTYKSILSITNYNKLIKFYSNTKKELEKKALLNKNNQKSSLNIPISAFNNKNLGSLEIVVKFLKENKNIKLKEISKILKKKYSTITNTYIKAKAKQKEIISINSKDQITIPLFVFEHSNLGPLQSLVIYLKDSLNMKNSVIAKLLNKSDKTIWSSYKNGSSKLKVKQTQKSTDKKVKNKILDKKEKDQILNIVISKTKEFANQLLKEDKSSLKIPIFIFDKNLGTLETVVKYLKENKKIKLKEISKILNKKYSTITNTYIKAKAKQKEIFLVDNDNSNNNILIPILVFKHSNLGPLQLLVVYLKDSLNLKNSVIARLLNKSDKTIWSTYHKAQPKLFKNE